MHIEIRCILCTSVELYTKKKSSKPLKRVSEWSQNIQYEAISMNNCEAES